jgi:glycosyltransferase involved in cell wall biosynthesis
LFLATTTTQLHAAASNPITPARLRRAIRVLQLGDSWSVANGGGGAARIFSVLAQHLPDHDISLTGAVAAPLNVAALTNGSIRCFSAANASTAQRWLNARRTVSSMLAANKPDLVASHFAFYTSAVILKLKPFVHVVHFHGPWSAESLQEGSSRVAAAAKYRLEKFVYRRAAAIIVLSKSFAELICARYHIDERKLRVIPGAVDLDHFNVALSKLQARHALDWPSDRPILLAVRRLSLRMGLHRLIRAMSTVKSAHPDVLLYIGGEGPQRSALVQQVAELGLQRHVRFAGFIPNQLLPIAYRAADINVVPTKALEGFGLIAAEALATGTPSMVTPVGGLPEVVAPLSNSLVFRSSSSAHIADGLIQALSGAIALPNQSACQHYARENFSADLMASRTAQVYRQLLQAS